MVKRKQYNHNEPAKYGVLCWSISEGNVPYTYASKAKLDGSERNVTGTVKYTLYLVNKLSNHVNAMTGMCQSIDFLLAWPFLNICNKKDDVSRN